MTKTWFWPVSIWLMFLLVLTGGILRKRTPASRTAPSTQSTKGKQSKARVTRVGIVLSVGGLGDQSFNDSAYKGLMQAKRLFKNLHVHFSEPRTNADARRDLMHFAREGYDLTIGLGFLMGRALSDVARKYPHRKFAIIDSVVRQKNVASLVFQEQEGSYLAGVLAALATRTGTVAFLGGMNIPLIRKFEAGFTQGVLDTRPQTKVLVGYVGSSPKAFRDAPGGRRLAVAQFGQGADIIFHAAGSSGMGAIKAAQSWNKRHPSIEQRRYIIGVDSNQDGIAKGSVLTSMIKRVDVAVFEIIKQLLLKRFENRVYRYGLPEGGVAVTDCRYALQRLPKNFRNVLKQKKNAIVQGKVAVPFLPEKVRRPSPK